MQGWDLQTDKGARIRLDKLTVSRGGTDRSSLRFVQHYSAAQYRDTVRKQLDWKKMDGQWKIVGETVLPAAPKAE